MKIEESILYSLQQPVLVLDGALHPIFANPSFFQLFELSSKDLKGEFVSKLLRGNICEPSLRLLIEPTSNNAEHQNGFESVCTLNSGKEIFLSVKACQLNEYSKVDRVLLELRDITKEKTAELSIQELNETLQKHAITVDAVNEELESYSHSVSHDLRTPLRFVNRIAHLLLHEPAGNLSDVAVKQINMIMQATTEMGKLIENLLIFSQVSREPIKKRRVDLKKLFIEAMKELENEQEEREVKIIIEEMEPCQGDRTLLKEVASNLIANSLKFTRQHKKAQISIGCTKTANETIYFIKDNGIGFDVEKSDALFLPFHKLHTMTEFEGSGIGLALVKRIIERHDGRIWAESEMGKGAAFYFTLEK